MFGLVLCSALSGLIMTKTGHYKFLPIVGGVLLTTGCFLLYLFQIDSGQGVFIPILFIIGAGLGLNIQTLTVIAQNAVNHLDIAVATTFILFCRTLGMSFGVALFESILFKKSK